MVHRLKGTLVVTGVAVGCLARPTTLQSFCKDDLEEKCAVSRIGPGIESASIYEVNVISRTVSCFKVN